MNVLISDKVTGTIRNDSVSLDSHYAPAERDMLLPVPHGYLNLSESVARRSLFNQSLSECQS